MTKQKSKKKNQADSYYECIFSIVENLISSYEKQEPVDLNKIRREASKTFKLSISPRIHDIISALPREYKTKILPYLRQKPVRTASGLKFNQIFFL